MKQYMAMQRVFPSTRIFAPIAFEAALFFIRCRLLPLGIVTAAILLIVAETVIEKMLFALLA